MVLYQNLRTPLHYGRKMNLLKFLMKIRFPGVIKQVCSVSIFTSHFQALTALPRGCVIRTRLSPERRAPGALINVPPNIQVGRRDT